MTDYRKRAGYDFNLLTSDDFSDGSIGTAWTTGISASGALTEQHGRIEAVASSSGAVTQIVNTGHYGFPHVTTRSMEAYGYLQLPAEGGDGSREVSFGLCPTIPTGNLTEYPNYLRFRLLDNSGVYTRTLLRRSYGAAEATVSGETVGHTVSGYSPLVKFWLDGTNMRVDLDGTQWLAATGHYLDFRAPLDSVFYLSGSTYTDNTAEAQSPSGTAFNLVTYSGTNYVLLGKSEPFGGVWFKLLATGNYGTTTWQYPAYTGASATGTWIDLTGSSMVGSSGFSVSPSGLSWTKPTDWVPITLNSAHRYWVRVSVPSGILAAATAYQILADATNYFYATFHHKTGRSTSVTGVFDDFMVRKRDVGVS